MSGRARSALASLITVFLLAGSMAAADSRVVTREIDKERLLIEVTADAPQIVFDPSLPGGYTRLSATNLPTLHEIGRPALPYRTVMVGVPHGKEIRLRVGAETRGLGASRLVPVMQRSRWTPGDRDMAPVALEEIEGVRSPLPGDGSLYPAHVAEVVRTGRMRDRQIAEIRVYPVRVGALPETETEADRERIVFHPRVRLMVDFVEDPDALLHRPRLDHEDSPFETVLSGAIVNYDMMAEDRDRLLREQGEEPEAPGTGSIHWNGVANASMAAGVMGAVKVEVMEDGLYEITPADLTAAGINVAMVDPLSFDMRVGGVSVPILVDGEGDMSFDPTDRVIFYGEGIKGDRFTLKNVYWLSFGGTAGPRMSSRSGLLTTLTPDVTPASFVTTVHAEVNQRYTTTVRTGVNEAWYWEIQTRGPSFPYNIDITRIDPAAHTVTVRGQFLGLSTATHNTEIVLNSNVLGQASHFGQMLHTNTQTGASGDLVEGANTIGLTLLNSSPPQSLIASDFFEVDYQRTYVVDGGHLLFEGQGTGTFHMTLSNLPTSDIVLVDITAPGSPGEISVPPAQVTGGGPFSAVFEDVLPSDRAYAIATRTTLRQPVSVVEEIPSSLADSSNGADYIIITDRSMLSDLAPLAAHRAGEGLRTLVATTDDIYDEFNDGVFNPGAIRAFLDYAYHNYVAPPPTYVVLAGDGHIDYQDNFGSGTPNYVPPTLLPFLNFGEAPSDNAYVTLTGGDVFPEMFIGRLPIRTPADASMIVSNIINYDTAPPTSTLNQQSLFVADNDDPIFKAILNNLHPDLPAGMAPATAYLPGDAVNPPSGAQVTATRDAIINGFDDGSLLAIYLGHGNRDIWAQEKILMHNPNPMSGPPRLDIDLLASSGNQSLLIALNCINGYFVDLIPAGPGHVDYSLAEEMLRHADRGAIASWAPSALGQLSDYDSMLFELFDNLFIGGEVEMGPLVVTAVVDAVNNFGINTANVEEMIFFGDPATDLALGSIPTCPGPAPEATGLDVNESGNDIVLTWDNAGNTCLTYKILAATNNGFPKSSVGAFVEIGTSATPSFTHTGAATDGNDYDYLIVVNHPTLGDGPLGAYGQ